MILCHFYALVHGRRCRGIYGRTQEREFVLAYSVPELLACQGNHQCAVLGFMEEVQTDLVCSEDPLTLKQLISLSSLPHGQELLCRALYSALPTESGKLMEIAFFFPENRTG